MFFRLAQADGKCRTEEPALEGSVSEEDSRVPYCVLRTHRVPDRHHRGEPVPAHFCVRRAYGGFITVQGKFICKCVCDYMTHAVYRNVFTFGHIVVKCMGYVLTN